MLTAIAATPGACETVLPVFESGTPIAYLVFGQLLDDSSVKQQWENAEKELGWYQGDLAELKEAFLRLRRFSPREMAAYAEILEAWPNTYSRRESSARRSIPICRSWRCIWTGIIWRIFP